VTGLALASVRHRRGSFVASFLAVFLGAGLVMAFASMIDTGHQPGVGNANRTTLTIMASVVGGWGAIIVASAIVTALSVAARQRAAELALLRSVGATPGQVIAMIMGEVLLISALAVVLAIPVGFGGGYALLHVLKDTGQVETGVGYRFGGAALGTGAGGSVLAAMIATWLTARRSARRRVQDALLSAAVGGRRMSRTRLVAGVVLLVGGISCAMLTATVLDGRSLPTQSVAGEGGILSALGFAVLAPVILKAVTALLGRLVAGLGGVPGKLGVLGIRQRGQQAATPLMPIVVCTAIVTGTLYMQSIWNSAHQSVSADDKNVETLNYVVVGMIAVFAAIMLVNLLVVEMTGRRREFAQLRLVGVTPRQILWLVGSENVLILTAGLLFGSFAALLTVVPYSIAVTHKALPDTSIGIYCAVVATVIVLGGATSVGAARRTLRAAAIAVIHSAAPS
jgi:putative ABC transport system permease protein